MKGEKSLHEYARAFGSPPISNGPNPISTVFIDDSDGKYLSYMVYSNMIIILPLGVVIGFAQTKMSMREDLEIT